MHLNFGDKRKIKLPSFTSIFTSKMGSLSVFVEDYHDYCEPTTPGLFFMFIDFEISIIR